MGAWFLSPDAHILDTSDLDNYIGKPMQPARMVDPFSNNDIRRWVQAMHYPNRLHYDAMYGMQSRFGQLIAPQSIEINDKKFTFILRPKRVAHPFSLTLLKATHTVYPGTVTDANPDGIPKDFRSRVLIENPQTHEDREVEISMNNPLRYQGLAFFQYQMSKDEFDRAPGSSTLQVVRNPSWLAPYIGCIVVAVGMCWQFLHHLVGFLNKRRTV